MARGKQVFISLAILVGGGGIAAALFATRPQAAQAPRETVAPLVEVTEARPQTVRVKIRALGEVEAARQVLMQAAVGGQVMEVHPNLVPGGHLKEDAVLLRIDPRDYKAAVAAQRAAVAQADVALAEERANKRVADYEWSSKTGSLTEDTKKFALREPHVRSAKQSVESARVQLSRARRDLDKTRVRAPFSSVVLSESVDLGQFVAPGTPVATLAGTGEFWVRVALPVSELRMLDIPGVSTEEEVGSPARVLQDVGAREPVVRPGAVDRLVTAVDARGKLAQLLVSVPDPLALELPPDERPLPLLIGTHVDVEIEGQEVEDVVPVPRSALYDGDRVWTVDEKNRLASREIEVVWREDNRVLASGGLSAGDRIVTTSLSVASPGMEVRVTTPEKPQPEAAE